MKKEAFQEIARHFADSIKVKLIFEDGATPSTNGTEIILPTELSENYIDETLGALLHETNHIRYTDFQAFGSWDKLSQEVGNMLEDIRIDNRSLQAYPNSRCFYMSLINDVINRCKEQLAKESLPVKIMKALILTSVGVDIKSVYGEDENFATIEEKVTNLQGTINDAIKCEKTDELPPHIVKVIKEIFGDLPEQKKQTGTGNPEKDCNGGQGGEGDPNNLDGDPRSGDGESSSGQGSGKQKGSGKSNIPSIDESGEVFEEYTELLEKGTEISEKVKASNEVRQEMYDKYKSNTRSAKTYDTKKRRIERDGYSRPLTAEEKAKKDKYEKAAKDRWDKVKDLQKQMNDQYAVEQKLNTEQYKFRDKLDNLKDTIGKIITNEFSRTGNCNLLGFNALDIDKLKDPDYVEVQFNPTLDEIIKEVLILKQEEYQAEETGKLNPRYYHEIYTDVENLFQEKEEKKILTRVSLVCDASGSMRGRDDLLLHAVNTLATSFSKAVAQGAPGDMKIYAFGTNVKERLSTVENYKPFTGRDFQIWMDESGGSTNMAQSVNHVCNEVTSDPEYRNIVIILTDAEVDDREIEVMTNNISTGDVRVMYIAIQSNLFCNAARELFGENNITTLENANEILQNVMFQGLQNLN